MIEQLSFIKKPFLKFPNRESVHQCQGLTLTGKKLEKHGS